MIPGSLSLISSSINDNEKGKPSAPGRPLPPWSPWEDPILGGALGDAGLWRYIFFINIPIGIAALIILWRKVEESRDEQSSGVLDFPGAILLALGLALLTFGFLRLPAIGFGHFEI